MLISDRLSACMLVTESSQHECWPLIGSQQACWLIQGHPGRFRSKIPRSNDRDYRAWLTTGVRPSFRPGSHQGINQPGLPPSSNRPGTSVFTMFKKRGRRGSRTLQKKFFLRISHQIKVARRRREIFCPISSENGTGPP